MKNMFSLTRNDDFPSLSSNVSKSKRAILAISLTAMFIALAAICKFFSVNIPIFGGSGMKVGLGGVFTSFPAIIFGPLYGGAASAASDIIGCIIAPSGAYNPLYTLTAFLGGFVKGLIWLAVAKSNTVHIKRIISVFFVICLVLGAVFTVSINSDGFDVGIIASEDEIPSRYEIVSENKSWITEIVTDRVQFSYGIKSVPDTEKVYIPSFASVDGYKTKITVGKTSFDKAESVKFVYVPNGINTFNASALEKLKSLDATVIIDEDAGSFESVENSGVKYRIATENDKKEMTEYVEFTTESPTANGMEFTLSTSYKKNLAGYINFATFGLSATGIFGIIAIALDYLIQRLNKGKSGNNIGTRVFASIFGAEIIVTTLNTVILKEMTYSSTWSGYPFYVILLPRVIEGVIICVIQAYLISVLYHLLNKALNNKR